MIASKAVATGGKNGGKNLLLRPEITAPEPCQNVFWRP